MITAIVFAKNEEKRIGLVLKNLENFSKIIVFDGGSSDETEKICNECGAQFVRRPDGLKDFCGEEYRWGMSQVATPYVLLVNCSHYYPKRLLDTFRKVAKEGKYHAVYHDIVIYTYGQIVQKPFFRRRSSGCNFFRVDSINFENAAIHREVPVDIADKLILRLEAIDGLSIHLFRDYDLKKTELTHSRYSEAEAKQRFDRGERASPLKILLAPLYKFFYQYIRCGSIIRGSAGLVYALLGAYLELSIQIRVWEIGRGIDLESVTNAHLKMRSSMINANF